MDHNEFLKYDINNIAFRITSREYFMGDVDRTSLNYGHCPKSRVVFSIPKEETTAPRTLSDNVTFKNDNECMKKPQISHSEGADVNVGFSSMSKLTLSWPTPISESFVRRRSSFNLSTFFQQTM
jgi:hypothetical protein